jgi:16S rRNA (cytidine1402-2'-O)-methyltransferase
LSDPAPFADLLGEITVVIGPPESVRATGEEEVRLLIARENARGGTPREVARRVQARAAGWTGKAIYTMMAGREKD